ncbi:MAG: PrsW family glutamic-type intramembrane protease [Opitutales bacterium]
MKRRGSSPSVFDEPHIRPSSSRRRGGKDPADSVTTEPQADGAAGNRYADWLEEGRDQTGALRSWLIILACALAAGPAGVIGAFWGSGQTVVSILALTVFGPAVEEMAKIMPILILVERLPYVVRNRVQILLCAFAGGLVFAVIENFLYLKVYIPDPGPTLVAWRWSFGIALHTGCSLVAGLGVAGIWSTIHRKNRPPRTEEGAPFFILAIVLHGGYNAFAILLERFNSPF